MEYKYALLRHQPSLHASEKENFAVLVEGRIKNGGVLFIVGRSVAPQVKVSEIAVSIGDKMPDVLQSLIQEAVRQKEPTEDVLDWVAKSVKFNFSLSAPEKIQDREPIYMVAFKLFSQHVAGADQLLEMMEKSAKGMVRPHDAKVSLGETFQTIMPVPEPELTMAEC
jgi:hypothetical protein